MNQEQVSIAPSLPVIAAPGPCPVDQYAFRTVPPRLSHVATPPGWILQTLDNEELMPWPDRKQGEQVFHDAGSFGRFVAEQKLTGDGVGSSRLYADLQFNDEAVKGLNFTAVLNDHGPDESTPHHRDFRAVYVPEFAVEFKRWSAASGKMMSQADFAEFLDDNAADIWGDWDGQEVEPPTDEQIIAGEAPTPVDPANRWPNSGAMQTFARAIEIHKDSRVKSAYDPLTGGMRLDFVDDETDNVKKRITAFSRFKVNIPVFRFDAPVEFEARLRVRQKGPVVYFEYKLVRPDRVVAARAKQMVGEVAVACGLKESVYLGEPG